MNKTKFIVVIATSVATVFLAIGVARSFASCDAVVQENIEALASGENGFGVMCSKQNTYGPYRMKLCSDCSGPIDSYAMIEVAYCSN